MNFNELIMAVLSFEPLTSKMLIDAGVDVN
jgi:hypothetical protein